MFRFSVLNDDFNNNCVFIGINVFGFFVLFSLSLYFHVLLFTFFVSLSHVNVNIFLVCSLECSVNAPFLVLLGSHFPHCFPCYL